MGEKQVLLYLSYSWTSAPLQSVINGMEALQNGTNSDDKENLNTNSSNARPAESTGSSAKSGGNRIGANGVILGPDGKPCKVRRATLLDNREHY